MPIHLPGLGAVQAAWTWARAGWVRLRNHPDVSMHVGDVQWRGYHPYPDDSPLTEIRMWLGFDNAGPASAGVSTIRLEVGGWPTLHPEIPPTAEELQELRQRVNPLIRAEEGRWLRPPLHIAGWDSDAGWVQFRLSGGANPFTKTFADARAAKARVYATVTGKGEISQPVAHCSYPRPSQQPEASAQQD